MSRFLDHLGSWWVRLGSGAAMLLALFVVLAPDAHWEPDWAAIGAFSVATGTWLFATLRGAIPPAHPSDIRLFEEIEGVIGHDERQLLRNHDFLNEFLRDRTRGVNRIYDTWDGPRYQFIDRKVQRRWSKARELIDAFALLTAETTSPMRGRIEFQTVRMSRGDDVTDREHQEAKALNELSGKLTKALDDFEALARRQLRL